MSSGGIYTGPGGQKLYGDGREVDPVKPLCPKCGGSGRIAGGICNCGSGEGCTLHNATAIAMWGDKCAECHGTGRKENK